MPKIYILVDRKDFPLFSQLKSATFIAAMEMSHEIRKKDNSSNWFFVETTKEYLLVDLCCP